MKEDPNFRNLYRTTGIFHLFFSRYWDHSSQIRVPLIVNDTTPVGISFRIYHFSALLVPFEDCISK